jgi:hypothetical protein
VERFASEPVDDRSSTTLQNAGYLDSCGSEIEIHLEIDRQEQCLERVRACRRKNGEKVAQGSACLARDDCFKRDALRLIRALVDDDLALAISLRDFTRPLVEPCPVQAGERRIVEMACDDITDEG